MGANCCCRYNKNGIIQIYNLPEKEYSIMLTYEELVSEVKKRPLQEQVSLLQELATVVNTKVNVTETASHVVDYEQTDNASTVDVYSYHEQLDVNRVPTAKEFLAMFSPNKGVVPMTKEETKEAYYQHLAEKYK
jgi:hypothetical protein